MAVSTVERGVYSLARIQDPLTPDLIWNTSFWQLKRNTSEKQIFVKGEGGGKRVKARGTSGLNLAENKNFLLLVSQQLQDAAIPG